MATMMECANVKAQGRRLREGPVRLPLPAVAAIGDTSTDIIPAACLYARSSCGEQGRDGRDHMLAPWLRNPVTTSPAPGKYYERHILTLPGRVTGPAG
jgi:hypothetical protein